MAHPIFDAPAYPWHRRDARTAREVMTAAVQAPALINNLYHSSGPDLRPLALGKPSDQIWMDALEQLATAGRIKHFCDVVLSRPDLAATHAGLRALVDAEDV